MNWLIFAFLAYFLLAITSIIDRYLLVGPIASPRAYALYHGVLWLGVGLLLAPFVSVWPPVNIIIFGLVAGLARIFAVLLMAKSIAVDEISRVLPAIGGFVPIFVFLLFLVFMSEESILNTSQIGAFVLLTLGSVLISSKKTTSLLGIFRKTRYTIVAAFLFAVSFFLMKLIFLDADFLIGLCLILLGGGVGAILLFADPSIRQEVAVRKNAAKTSFLFLLGAGLGGLGVLAQFYAVFLAGPGQVPLINALEGIRYVFVLGLVYVLAIRNPRLLKEEIGRTVIVQKIFAILLIWFGLILLR